jgi:methylenetetrahydrofolate reductase (NADPH)
MSWKFWKKTKAELTEDQRAALKRLVGEAKFELIPLDSAMAKAQALPPGAAVTVTASPSHGIEATFDLCETLAALGHEVTPHLSAHMTRDRATCRSCWSVHGSPASRGSSSSAATRRTRASSTTGFICCGRWTSSATRSPRSASQLPGRARRHRRRRLAPALTDKQRYATAMTTQMCFNPGPSRAGWQMRAAGITLPVHLGVPGSPSSRS